MSEIPDKYAHLFEDEKPKQKLKPLKPKPSDEQNHTIDFTPIMGWFAFKRMYATGLLSALHTLIQIGLIIYTMRSMINVFTQPFETLVPGLYVLAGLVLMVIVRVLFEGAIVLFRIYEELAATRQGIDSFNAKVQARASTSTN